jgi:uncharacterized protein YdeI (YjbR/CyaY-like superfamily)
MEQKNGIEIFNAKSRAQWRKWLEKNHLKEKSVWLIVYKKESGMQGVNYLDAVDEALCFGWIDSKANKRDDKSYYQYFSLRKPASKWSITNKKKVARFTKQGLMSKAGLDAVKVAKQRGTWASVNESDLLLIPEDLQKQLNENEQAQNHWNLFSRSVRKAILEWIKNAKRPETRKRRIDETVKLAAQNKKANQYNQ